MHLKRERLYECGPFRLEPDERRLTREGMPLPLSPKVFDLLVYLVQNAGRLLTKEELLGAVWPDTFVEEANLTVAVSSVRKALGEKDGHLRYIETVPRTGYRFIAPVRELKTEPFPPASDGEAPGLSPEAFAVDESACAVQSPIESEETNRRQDAPAPTPAASLLMPRKILRRPFAVFLFLGLLLLLGVYVMRRVERPGLSSAAGQRTLAILPLQNLKQSPEDDYLSFALADAVITELGPVRSLTVRPSSAIEKYRGQTTDVHRIAADLHVDTLLTGGFIHEGNDLRITYQLVDVRTDKILGRDRIDLRYDKLMTAQDIVAQRIIQGLALSLPPAEAAQVHPDVPMNPLAFEYFLRGVDRMGSHDFPIAVEMLQKSTQLDSDYAPSWAYLGQSYNSMASFQFGGRERYEKARNAFEHALALQPKQVEARIFLSNFLIDTGEVEKAVPLLRDAQRDNPTNASLYWELGYAYRFAGMLEESLAECQHARQIDPWVKGNGAVFNTLLYLGRYDEFLADIPESDDSSFLTFYRGFAEYHREQWDRAERDFDRAWQLEPTLYSQTGEALSDAIRHRPADGLAQLHNLERRIEQQGVGDPEGIYKIAEAFAVLGDKESALRMFRYSIENGFFSWPYFRSDPLLANIRKDAQFPVLMETAHRRYEAFRQQFF